MSNESYCRFENTLEDLEDCYHALANEDMDKLSKSEKKAKNMLIKMCFDISADFYEED